MNAWLCEAIAVYRRESDGTELRLHRNGDCWFAFADGQMRFGNSDVTFEQVEKWLREGAGAGFVRVDQGVEQ